MFTSKKFKKLFAISTIVTFYSTNSYAMPTMFVNEESNYTWEGDLKLVPNSTRDGGITVDDINTYLREQLKSRAVESPSTNYIPICLMNFAHYQDIASSDRKTQQEIRANLEEYPKSFEETWDVGGEHFLLRVGIFEDCSASDSGDASSPLKFMALVVTDGSGKIRYFDATNWSFIRLFKRPDGGMNVLGCFACGEVQEIRYDANKNDFYFKWLGH